MTLNITPGAVISSFAGIMYLLLLKVETSLRSLCYVKPRGKFIAAVLAGLANRIFLA